MGIARAFLLNLQGGRVQGGSSITVQLIKNILIPEEERYEVKYSRKIKEAILAMEISRQYSKDQILEWYLNTNHYGNLAYGIQAAAQVYFQKSVSELSLAECALLAPIPQYPMLNPIDNPEEAKNRQGLALEALARDGYVTTRGWLVGTQVRVVDLCRTMRTIGVARFVYTDVRRDGTLTEPNFEALEEVARGTDAPVVAAGGIATIEHVRRVRDAGAAGAILGKAIYTGSIDLREAISLYGG